MSLRTITPTSHEDDGILSDEQIQSLLLAAEARLRSTSQGNCIQPASTEPATSSSLLRLPTLDSTQPVQSYIREQDKVATFDQTRTVTAEQKKSSETIRSIPQVSNSKIKMPKEKPTAGSNWFDLPKTNLTAEMKRDLQLLRMRPVLDPHRHYKKDNSKAKAPEYSQVGTIIEGPTEFFSARIPKKLRKRTFVEEALAIEHESGRFRRKYEEIQATKTSGKTAHYKSIKAKRSRGSKFG
ncbi:rRNA-processing protein FCF2 [Histoplasma ohiense]|nr:rRNA-processing protein FCF2 [Histoplasma ohiense (nom. inval.)]